MRTYLVSGGNMKTFLVAILALIIPTLTYAQVDTEIYGAAEAQVDTEITVNAPVEKTINFIEKNPKLFREAAEIELLQDLGNGKLKVRRESPKGVFIWIMQEHIAKKDGMYHYKSTLVESIEGGIEKSDTDIIVQSNQDGTLINVKISAIVNNKRVKTSELRFDLIIKASKIRRLLEANLEDKSMDAPGQGGP